MDFNGAAERPVAPTNTYFSRSMGKSAGQEVINASKVVGRE